MVKADRGYDNKATAEGIESRGAQAVITTQKYRKERRAVDPHLYAGRNLCERLWSKVEHYLRMATRYEKTGDNVLACVEVAAVMVMAELLGHSRSPNSCPCSLVA